MGRKIPGKKHRGVKDPAKQHFERNEKLKTLINAPPSHPNVQELPKSVLELNRLRELAKNMNLKKNKRKKRKVIDSGNFTSAGPMLPGMQQKDLEFPKVIQNHGESDRSFLWRLDSAANEALNEANIEVKYDVVVNHAKNGKITDVLPKSRSVEEHIEKLKKRSIHNKHHGNIESAKDKLSYLKEKKLKKKLKKIDFKEEELEKKKDFVKFGEVVHQPPQFKSRPRGCNMSSSDRPGKKKLLLTDLLQPNNCGQSMCHMKQIASAREEAMKVYRDMKAKNRLLQKT